MKTILVIDDATALREEIIEALEYLEFQVIGAANGAIGMQLAQEHLPDLIVCDIMMPEIDGYAVLKALRQNRQTAAIPFIFLSAKADKLDMRQGMNLGADDYLTKPFTLDELSATINARLEKQEAIASSYSHKIFPGDRDSLTNLPHRDWLLQRLQEILISECQNIAVFHLNIDDFKSINNDLGYVVGDLLLQSFAQRLSISVRPEDFVARLSGDEFGMILVNIDQQQATDLAVKIKQTLCQPYTFQDRQIAINVSIGITLYPADNSNSDKLLSHADKARHWAKAKGGGNYQFYNPQIDALATERDLIFTQLSHALERSEFQLHYQPQINLMTGQIIGAEALLRWRNQELGQIPPDKFIPLAEETGLINAIGEWVLRAACTQGRIWQVSGLLPSQIAVNMSVCQLKQGNFSATVAQILQQTSFDPGFLELEITETGAMEDIEATIAVLHELKAMGISIAIDDFGTGYSSLNYLKRFPIDVLKIDRSFTSEVTTDASDAAIAQTIIHLAQSLHLKAIAEGVETLEQLEFLRQQGCYAMQGYLFSPAVPALEFEQMLRNNSRLLTN